MNLKEYKDLLEEKDIYLFDSIYRITHYKLINLTEIIDNKQLGGGKQVYFKPLNNIRRKSREELINIINNLYNNKYEKVEIMFLIRK